jgi:hypothetical protein
MDIVTRHHEVSTMKIKRALQASRRSRRPIKEWISPLFGRSWLAYRMLNGIRASLNPAREMEPLLRCWMPAAVFANDVFDPAEGALLRCARRLGVRTVGMVRSWDNPTNKGVLPTPIDRLLVWS